MKTLKTILEGILDDAEVTLARGDEDLAKALDLDKLPTIKDFKTNPYNRHYHVLSWECPNILEKYRKLYPYLIDPKWNGIQFSLDTEYKHNVELSIYFAEKMDPVTRRKWISGWHDTFAGATLATYKKMVMKVLDTIAKDTDKMDEVMKYAAYYVKKNSENQPNTMHTFTDLKFLVRL